MKIGEILDPDGVPRWEVFRDGETDAVLVERDAPNGSEDDIYACVEDLCESLAPGYSYRGKS